MTIAPSSQSFLLQNLPGGPLPWALLAAMSIPPLLTRAARWSGLRGLALLAGGLGMLAGWLLLAPAAAPRHGGASLFNALIIAGAAASLLLPWPLPPWLARLRAGGLAIRISLYAGVLAAGGWWLARAAGFPAMAAGWGVLGLALPGAALLLDRLAGVSPWRFLAAASCSALTCDAIGLGMAGGMRWLGLVLVTGMAAMGLRIASPAHLSGDGKADVKGDAKAPPRKTASKGAAQGARRAAPKAAPASARRSAPAKAPPRAAPLVTQMDSRMAPLQYGLAIAGVAAALTAAHAGGLHAARLPAPGYAAGLIWLPSCLCLLLAERFSSRTRLLRPEPLAAGMALWLSVLVTYSAAALTGLR